MTNSKALSPLGRAPLSSAVEDYLKAIYNLREEGETGVSTQALANRLEVAAPSATTMIKRLAQMGLAQHTPYRGVELTPAGEKIALEIVRHHRIIETYLAQILGMSWDAVHDEAERLEHVLSEEVEARMMAALGHPTRDPHGAPIPSADGILPQLAEIALCDAPENFVGEVVRVADESAAALRHWSELGLRPGAQVLVARHVALEGVLHLEVDGLERIIGALPARGVWLLAND